MEGLAISHAVSSIIPAHFSLVRQNRQAKLDKVAKAVRERMTDEIQYWDFRAANLKQKEVSGKVNARLNSENAHRRAEDLEARMRRRLAEIEAEKDISAMPPVIVGGALVIPKGLLYRLTRQEAPADFAHSGRRAIEYAAMKAVMEIETGFGYLPRDVSAKKRGYDIESEIPPEKQDGGTLRFIEVKGRVKGAATVTVSKNEILTALNKPEAYILAIVEVDGASTRTVYLKKPFQNAPDFASTSVNYDIAELADGAEKVYP